MDDRLSRLEARLQDLTCRLERLERREAEGAGAAVESPSVHPVSTPTQIASIPSSGPSGIGGAVPLLGRTLLALGGAYLLRWMTESHLLPWGYGLALGLAYAFIWVGLADRSSARGHRASAMFHGSTAAAIGYPLVWEATARFHLVSPALSAGLLAGLTLALFGVAGRRNLKPLGWLAGLAATGVALALAVGTRLMLPYVACLLAAAVAGLWLGYLRRWHFEAVLAAIGADMAVAFVALFVLLSADAASRFGVTGTGVLLIQLALIASYLGSSTMLALLRGRDITVPEVVQATTVMLIGLGGGVLISRATGAGIDRLAVGTLALAVGGYAVSFTHIERRRDRRRNFAFFTTLALASAVVSFELLLRGAPRALALSLLALATAYLGGRYSRVTLSIHSALYVLAGALSSGLLARAARVFFTRDVALARWGAAPGLLVLAASLVCFLVPMRTTGHVWGRWARLPKAVILGVLALVLGGMVVSAVSAVLSQDDRAPDPGILATLRTTALGAIAVLLAAAARWRRVQEAGLLVYPALVLAGVKFLADELPNGRPATMFFSLGVLGSALILASKWGRRADPAASP